MEECKKISPVDTDEQISLEGIYPGITTKQEVEELIGLPEEQFEYHDLVWNYGWGEPKIKFSINKSGVEVVQSAVLSGEEYGSTLSEIIATLGCPSAIFGFRYVFPEPSEKYEDLTLIYLRAGIAFLFRGESILHLEDLPSGVLYFIPGSIEHYFYWHVGLEGVPSMDLDFAKPFDWDDVVGIDKE